MTLSKCSKLALPGLLLIGGLAFALFPLDKRLLQPEHSATVYFRDGQLVRGFLTTDDKWRLPPLINEWPPFIVDGLICLEDKRYFSHWGVDPLALARALRQNWNAGRILSGGSTITMQSVRMAHPRKRTVWSKIIESTTALRLEAALSKEEILTTYFSYLPFGGNIEGLETASHVYFQKPVKLLTTGELAFLYSLPQRPRRWNKDSNTSLVRAKNRVLRRWKECELIDDEQLSSAQNEPIPRWQNRLPAYAHHFAEWITGQVPDITSHRSHLQLDIQRAVEAELAKVRKTLNGAGIKNASVLVIDNETWEVRAAVGNFQYYSDQNEQKIPGFLQFRSPGSLLKPFLFAKLLETGKLLPQTKILDTPFDSEDYHPENYDGEFAGFVTAEQALAKSLNVPWVRLLHETGFDSFLSFLSQAGLQGQVEKSKLGLSIVVGAMQVRMVDLVPLYVSLANNGRLKTLKFTEADKVDDDWQWIHPAAAQMTNQAMKLRGRPDYEIPPQALRNQSVHWKTGTSQGRRDAWAIGFDHDHTVAVWLGNLNYDPSPQLVGASAAAPILFDIFARIQNHSTADLVRPISPHLVTETEVCAFSGLPPTPACEDRVNVESIKGLVIDKNCPYHEHNLVDKNSGYRVHQNCNNPKLNPVVKSVLKLPADVHYWAKKNIPGLTANPPFHPSCYERPVDHGNLEILTPEDKTYLLHSGFSENRMTLPIRIKTAGRPQNIRCFLNGNPLDHHSKFATKTISLEPGDYSLFCTDPQGSSDKVNFLIR